MPLLFIILHTLFFQFQTTPNPLKIHTNFQNTYTFSEGKINVYVFYKCVCGLEMIEFSDEKLNVYVFSKCVCVSEAIEFSWSICPQKMCMCFGKVYVVLGQLFRKINVYVFQKCVCGLEIIQFYAFSEGKKCVCFFEICMYFRGN